MKFELKNFLINICGWIIIISMCFFLVVFVIFIEDKVQQPFKETLTLTLSFLSALATIGAAIIAARIFQTWKTQHSYVEQIKILSQMLQKVSEINKNLSAARKNENLAAIIAGVNSSPNLDTLFLEQAEKVKVLDHSLNSLFELENQIYLLSNDRRKKPVFYDKVDDSCPLEAFLDFNKQLEINIWDLHSLLYSDLQGNVLRYEEFDIEQRGVQWLLLTAMSDGAWYISQKATLDDDFINNSINEMLKKWLIRIQERIMYYRDSLDTLN